MFTLVEVKYHKIACQELQCFWNLTDAQEYAKIKEKSPQVVWVKITEFEKEITELQDKLHRRNMQIKNLQAEIKKFINERGIYEKYISPEQLSADDAETLTNS